MTRLSLARAVASKTGFPVSTCQAVVGAFFASCEASLAAGDTVELRGHFALRPCKTKTRFGNNPRTGERVMIPGHRTAKARFYYGRDWLTKFVDGVEEPLLLEIMAAMECHKHHYTARDKAR